MSLRLLSSLQAFRSRAVKLSRTGAGVTFRRSCSTASRKVSLIKDTTHFLNKLEQLGQLPDNAFLDTLDVSSLYTNIPHNEGIDACRHFLDKRIRSPSTISTETLCDLIRMILTMNNFTFNDKNYLQIHGTAMVTRMAPSYANLFLAKFETDALSRAPYQPHTGGRYIDDIFMIHWTHSVDDLKTFTTTFTQPSNLRLTILSHPYHFLTSTCLSLTVNSRLTFTLNLPTNINTCYNLHVILNTLRELFHSA